MPARRRKPARKGISPLKIVLAAGLTALVLMIAGLLVAKSKWNAWLHGEGFRDWLVAKAAVKLRSEVELAPLEWNGAEVYAKRFVAKGYEEAGFSSLVLDGVRARTGGIADRAVRIPEVSVNRFELAFSPERKRSQSAGAAVGAEPEAASQGLPDWLARHLPNRVEVDEVAIATTKVTVEKAEGSVFSLQGTKLRLEPDFQTGFWSAEGSGGRIALPDLPEMRLKDLALRWKGQDLFFDHCGIGIFEEGHIDGKGEISLGKPGNFDLALTLSAIDVDDLLTGAWKDRLSGTVSGPVRITGAPGALVHEGTLNLADGVLQSVPVLTLIAKYTRSDRFERLVLNQAKTGFRREGDRTELRDLVIQSDGLVRVEGQIDLVGDLLDGDLRVGVAPGTMRWIPGAERSVFVEERDGFLWTPLKLTGTRQHPKEDLSARLIAAVGEAILGDLPGGLLDTAKEVLGTEPAKGSGEGVIEQGRKIIDLLSPFLKAP